MSMKSNMLKSGIAIFIFTSLLFLFSCKSDDDSNANLYKNCCNTDPLLAELDTGKIYIPNVFTPNADGNNDLFFVMAGSGVEMVNSFVITKPNGTMMFEQETFIPNNPALGWDGSDSDGNIHRGHFNYTVQVTSINGAVGEYNGSACSVVCDLSDEGFTVGNTDDCRHGTQHDGGGGVSASFPTFENDCF